jgi:hypothetical protein
MFYHQRITWMVCPAMENSLGTSLEKCGSRTRSLDNALVLIKNNLICLAGQTFQAISSCPFPTSAENFPSYKGVETLRVIVAKVWRAIPDEARVVPQRRERQD